MRRVLLPLILAVMVAQANAGENATGKAWLSWDPEGVTSQISEPPSYEFPLFLHLADAPDIRMLAVDLRWSMGDSSQCYTIVSSPPDIGCGWATDSLPGGDFEGDSTYTWKITFQEGSSKSCVVYTVSAAACTSSSAATFWLASVATKDGSGEVDSLEVQEQATIGPTGEAPQGMAPETVPGVILLEFDASSLSGDQSAIGLRDVEPRILREFLRDRGFAGARKMYRDAASADTMLIARDGRMARIPDVSRWYVLKVDSRSNVERLVDTLATLPGIKRARVGRAIRLAATPSDPEFQSGQQWQFSGTAGVHASDAWDLGTGRADVIMGIVDTGVDYTHPDLDPGDRSHVIAGYDTGDQDTDPMDDVPRIHDGGHGSAVAGLVAALTNNGRQVAGAMWNASILPVKIMHTNGPWWCPWCDPGIYDWDAADGIRWAATHGANIINMSFGGPDNLNPSELLGSGDPIATSTYTAFQLGALPLAAMGNDNSATVSYPAGYPWCLAVGATDGDSARVVQLNWGSNFGPHIDVVAPGLNTWTVDRDLGTYFFSGTSAATPVASGVAGLILAEGRDWGLELTNEDVAEILERSATDLVRPGVGWDQFTGFGLVNARRALELLNPPYSVSQESALSGAVTMTWGPHTHNFTNNGGLPGGQYYGVKQYEVRRHIDFCGLYASAPEVWARGRQTVGWSAANPNSELPWGNVENVTASGFDVRTFVYHIPYDLQGRYVDWWYPCRPEQAVMAWTVLGNNPLQSLEIDGPTVDCAVELDADCCGGAVDLAYEWYERPANGEWSGIVGTDPTYSRVLPGEDMEFKVVARSAGNELVDTHYVTYQNCTVAVPQGESHDLSLTLSPNPIRGKSMFAVEIPVGQHVDLSVYDLNGRLVKQIVNDFLPPGIHRFEWSNLELGGARVASGLYFARLTTPSGDRKVKLVVTQ